MSPPNVKGDTHLLFGATDCTSYNRDKSQGEINREVSKACVDPGTFWSREEAHTPHTHTHFLPLKWTGRWSVDKMLAMCSSLLSMAVIKYQPKSSWEQKGLFG